MVPEAPKGRLASGSKPPVFGVYSNDSLKFGEKSALSAVHWLVMMATLLVVRCSEPTDRHHHHRVHPWLILL